MSKLYIPDLTKFSWQPPVVSRTGTVPVSPTLGDRYIITSPDGDWGTAGFSRGNIAWYTGGSADNGWVELAMPLGAMTYDLNSSAFYYKATAGTDWSAFSSGTSLGTLLTDINAITNVISDSFLVGDGDDSMTVKTPAQVMATLSGKATSSFSFLAQNVSTTGTISSGGLNVGTGTTFTQIVYDTNLKAVVFTY